MRLRKDVGPYLVAFVSEYHKLVSPIDKSTFDDWAWSPLRTGRASSRISDHCGGVAVDVNATGEGRQGRGLAWFLAHPVRYRRLKGLLKKYRLLEWGGFYSAKNVDPMHFVIKTPDVVAVRREMLRLGITPTGRFKTVSGAPAAP